MHDVSVIVFLLWIGEVRGFLVGVDKMCGFILAL